MTTEIAVASNGTLAVAGDQHEWTPVQRAAFAHIGIEDAPDADKQVFHHVCQITGLDPFRKQIYMIGRPEKQEDGSYRKKWTIQTAIDGFRVVAEEHPQFAGTLDPEWCGPDGVWRETWTDPRPPVMARVKVLRHDRAHPITLPLRFNEFAATFKNGDLRAQWREKPAHMIAKCAEAAALRKAFPQQLAGVYTDDEMEHTDNPSRGRRGVVVEQDAQPVTAAELTGAPPRDWDGEIGYHVHLADIDGLRDLYRQAEGRLHVRDRITAAVQELRSRPAPDPDEVVSAEIVDEDRTDEYVQAMADETGADQ
jgi:phage recombination protein Bet